MRALLAGTVAGGLAVLATAGLEVSGAPKPASSPVVVLANSPAAVASNSGTGQIDHRCADLLVEAQIRLAIVPGVWGCLEPAVQALFKGTGDGAVSGSDPYFTGYRLMGCDDSICVYLLSFEATTAARTGISETTMTVWLDDRGLVAHAAIPKAIP